jgi:hypothetical protein
MVCDGGEVSLLETPKFPTQADCYQLVPLIPLRHHLGSFLPLCRGLETCMLKIRQRSKNDATPVNVRNQIAA